MQLAPINNFWYPTYVLKNEKQAKRLYSTQVIIAGKASFTQLVKYGRILFYVERRNTFKRSFLKVQRCIFLKFEEVKVERSKS